MSSKPPQSDAGAAPPKGRARSCPGPAGRGRPRRAAAAEPETETTIYRRDRLLASMTLITGAGVLIALPFALRAGAEFFLPVTAALVIAIALVPALEWLERRRVPSGLAAFLCLMLFLIIANAAVAAIVFPASEWVKMLPERIDRVRDDAAADLRRLFGPRAFIDNVAHEFSRGPGLATQTVTVETPNSLLQIIATSAPFAIIQMFFAILVIYLLPRRLDPDAQAHDHQPGELRRRDDHGAGDPAGGRRDLDLSRHDHHGEHRPGRWSSPSSSGCSACRIAADVGRHRRGAELHPLSRADRRGAAARASAG